MHRFLASLTDTTWKMEGVTVLYIPKEGTDVSIEEAAKNKDLIQRLESKINNLYQCKSDFKLRFIIV
jgi:dynein heavy chain